MNNLPFFYLEEISPEQSTLSFDQDASKHIVQVLRMKESEKLQVTDGKGVLATGEILDANKKKCTVNILQKELTEKPLRSITICISLLKNANRFEWFVEKACEIGITQIVPLLCERTEKQRFRYDRIRNICISAMLQSQQVWLTELTEPKSIAKAIPEMHHEQKFIGHCLKDEKSSLSDLVNVHLASQVMLIGPEGDFTNAEIDMALAHHFIPAALGETRLRSETAGVVAAAILNGI